jgi:trans-aconitate 2-methyltransferase
VDLSPEMLTEAARRQTRVRWVEADIATWQPGRPVDVVYSNATLHWLDDHDDLFPRLIGLLGPKGVLAVQMPLSWTEPSHVLMREVLATGGDDGAPLGPDALRARLARLSVADPAAYYDLLAPLVEELDIWTSRYLQVLAGPDAVLEWVRATGLRPVLNGLPRSELERFLIRYREKLATAYPPQPSGTTLYPFPRLFIVARKGQATHHAGSPRRRPSTPCPGGTGSDRQHG